jgi:hypothetical protein
MTRYFCASAGVLKAQLVEFPPSPCRRTTTGLLPPVSMY